MTPRKTHADFVPDICKSCEVDTESSLANVPVFAHQTAIALQQNFINIFECS